MIPQCGTWHPCTHVRARLDGQGFMFSALQLANDVSPPL